jgi:hypothetical protein
MGVLMPMAPFAAPMVMPRRDQVVAGEWSKRTTDGTAPLGPSLPNTTVMLRSDSTDRKWVSLPFSCSVVSINVSIGSTGHLSGGSISALATLNTALTVGGKAGPAATLSVANQAAAGGSIPEGVWQANPGDLIGANVTTSSDYAATATRLDVAIGVIPH